MPCRLLRAFETPSGIPYNSINLQSGQGTGTSWAGGVRAHRRVVPCAAPFAAFAASCKRSAVRSAVLTMPRCRVPPLSNEQNLILSESTTMMIEFTHLTKVTGDPKYAAAVGNSSVVIPLPATSSLPGRSFRVCYGMRELLAVWLCDGQWCRRRGRLRRCNATPRVTASSRATSLLAARRCGAVRSPWARSVTPSTSTSSRCDPVASTISVPPVFADVCHVLIVDCC